MFNKTLSHIKFSFARKIAQEAKYRQTVRELSALNDRELADIGLSRCDIVSVAKGLHRERVGA